LSRTSSQKSPRACTECGSGNTVEDPDAGELVCRDCGLVLNDKERSRAPEWRNFQDAPSRSRSGPPPTLTLHDKGLATTIDAHNRDHSGRPIPLSTRLELLQMRKWQIRTRVTSTADRNLAQALTEIDRLAGRLRLPAHVKEQAAQIYRQALTHGLVRGRSITALADAAAYAACRQTGTARNLKDLTSATNTRRKDAARCYRLLVKALDIKVTVERPAHLIPRIAEPLRIPPATQQYAAELLQRTQASTTGKDPMGLAAAALYIASQQKDGLRHVTQKQLATVAKVTEVTVRNRYKALLQTLQGGGAR
jgi:transcription initiation factor TFIIB